MTFSGLLGNTTASHIHAATAVAGVGTAGVATQTPSFSGFPLGVKAGAMDTTFDMTLASSFNASYIATRTAGRRHPLGPTCSWPSIKARRTSTSMAQLRRR